MYNKLFKKLRDAGTVNRWPGNGRPRSALTEKINAKLLLQKFPQSANDFVFFTDKKMFSVTSPDNRQNKVSGRLRKLLKKKLSVFFSAPTAR